MNDKELMINDEDLTEVTGGGNLVKEGMTVIGDLHANDFIDLRNEPDMNSAVVSTVRPGQYGICEIEQNQFRIWYRLINGLWVMKSNNIAVVWR